jgi:dienelactone hydrolase
MKDYTAKGSMVAIQDVECYVAWPAAPPTCAVVVFQDIFGIHSGRHKQFCDMLAEQGYGAVAPDFTGTDPIVKNPPMYGYTCCCFWGLFGAILTGNSKRKTAQLSWDASMGRLVLDCVVPWLKQRGVAKLVAAGFCFGSYGAMHCGRFPEIFSCSASFHPSTQGFCKATKEDDLALCRAVKAPQLVVATSMESQRWRPSGDAHRACEEDGTATVWLLEEKQRHGFMMRGDTSNAETLSAVRKYMDMMLQFFEANVR